MSFDTRGFAAWLLARPRRWEIRAGALPYLLKDNSSHGHVGRDKARRFLRELVQAGYLTRTRMRGEDGCWIWRNMLTAVPTIDGSAVDGSSGNGKGVDTNQISLTTNELTSNSINLQAVARNAIGAPTVVGSDKKIRFPEILSGEYLASARKLVSTCPPEQRQALLDEVAAVHRRGALRKSAIGLLHRLVERASAGTFVPSYAISSREREQREKHERELLLERRSREPATGPSLSERSLRTRSYD